MYDGTHELFRESFAAFVDAEMVPKYHDWEVAGIMDRELYTTAGKHGFVGMAVPEQHGGGGSDDFRFNAIIAEELAKRGINGAGLGLTLHNDIVTRISSNTAMTSKPIAGCQGSHRASWSQQSR